MARVKIWVSDVPGITNAFLIDHDDGRQDFYPLATMLAPRDRLGAAYRGEFQGHAGTYYDLPSGFPTSDQTAEKRLSDPSIPATMKKLIVDHFPLKARRAGLVCS
ncbi:MAG: hypothetical protein V4719_04505 [Planctomycetota bacterium]